MNQTLEIQIKTAAEQANNELTKTIKNLGLLGNKVSNVSVKIDKNGSIVSKQFTEANKEGNKLYKTITSIDKNGLKTINSSVREMNSGLKDVQQTANKISSFLSIGGLVVGLKSLASSFSSLMDSGVNYSEQLNLFNVAFNNFEKNGVQTYSEVGKAAIQFQNKMNESFGTNKAETLYMQGIFEQMGLSTSIPEKYSAILSENMTKLSYDLASLYNKGESEVAEALRAGVYAGQTKPLRGYGIDVTENSTETLLRSLGITDRSMDDLSYAEKEILRYLQTLKQSQKAMGDFANTVNSPANQLKILKQQLVELKTATSSLFMGLYADILPFINGVIMALKEVIETVATIFGIELKDYNTGIGSIEDSVIDFGDSLGTAASNAKELKKQLLSFDEVHNINENTSSGSGSGASYTGTGIDQRLLDAITGYDNKLSSVKNKAVEIRDKIMDWLGFTKKTNIETKETYFTYEGWNKTWKNIKKAFSETNTLTKIFIGLGLASIVAKILNSVKGLYIALGGSGLTKVIKSLLTPTKELAKVIKTDLKGNINTWSSALTWVDKFKNTLVGAGGLVIGFSLARDAAKEFNEEGKVTSTVMAELLGSGVSSIAGGALIGATYGGAIGAAIGAAGGAVLTLVTCLGSLKTETQKTSEAIMEQCEQIGKVVESYNEYNSAVDEQSSKTMSVIENDQKYLKELDNIVDANGKIKAGYEARAEFILNQLNEAYGTEYKIVDGIITKYDELKTTIDELIEKKKLEALIDAGKSKWSNAIENQTTYWENYQKALGLATDAEKNYYDELEKFYNSGSVLVNGRSWFVSLLYDTYDDYVKAVEDGTGKTNKAIRTTKEAYDETQEKLKETSKVWYESNQLIENYEDLLAANITGNQEEISSAIDKYTKDNNLSISEQILMYQNLSKESSGLKDTTIENHKTMYNSLIDTLKNETVAIKGEGETQAEAWYNLAKTDKDKFLEAFSSLPTDVQQNVVNKMYSEGKSISQELQNGINSQNPTIKFKGDMSSVESEVKYSLGTRLKNWFSNLFGGGKASGGSFYGGSWHNIPQYANGGSPSHGTMFVAGEAGAEVVGHVNGRTEVLNQSQLASVMYSAVAQAMSQYGNGGGVELYLHTDEGVVVDRINKTTKQTGVCPINIPY